MRNSVSCSFVMCNIIASIIVTACVPDDRYHQEFIDNKPVFRLEHTQGVSSQRVIAMVPAAHRGVIVKLRRQRRIPRPAPRDHRYLHKQTGGVYNKDTTSGDPGETPVVDETECPPEHCGVEGGELTGSGDTIGGNETECPPEHCGVDGTDKRLSLYGSLSLDGIPNADGLAIVDFLDASGRSLALDIIDGELVGVSHDSGDIILRGKNLVGSTVVLSDAHDVELELHLAGVQ